MKNMICNPLNLEYRYQIKKDGNLSALKGIIPKKAVEVSYRVFREAADPSIILFKGVYYLFASMSAGFWYSEDLCDWKFKETSELPIYDYAPDVREIDGAVVFSASKTSEPSTFYRTKDPLNETFEAINSPFPFHDPNTFQDDDGRVYFYWGCSNSEPIYGQEIDRTTFEPIGEKVALFGGCEKEHGWERSGENNIAAEPTTELEIMKRQYIGTRPFIEGAFMNKYEGRYYLQYSAPGTEFNIYADGVYVGESPLGPFIYQEHNPISIKPGGFIQAAGHGSTFQDKYGNWWHASTMRISINESFERRIGLFPCGFDKDGIMYCNQEFADYPMEIPSHFCKEHWKEAPTYMLLSYGKNASASSYQEGYEPQNGTDENIRTWWAADAKDDHPWYQLDLGEVMNVHALQINFADHQGIAPNISDEDMRDEGMGMAYRYIVPELQSTKYYIEYSVDGDEWEELLDRTDGKSDLCHDFINLDEAPDIRLLRIRNIELPFKEVASISGLRVFGLGKGEKPQQVNKVNAVHQSSGMDINLSWEPALNAIGYNVRYGIAPDKLYSSWQLYNCCELCLSTLNKGIQYYCAIDSFNESGVTKGETKKL